MFQPTFQISNKILTYIAKIEAAEEVIRHAPILPLWEKQFREDDVRGFHGHFFGQFHGNFALNRTGVVLRNFENIIVANV